MLKNTREIIDADKFKKGILERASKEIMKDPKKNPVNMNTEIQIASRKPQKTKANIKLNKFKSITPDDMIEMTEVAEDIMGGGKKRVKIKY